MRNGLFKTTALVCVWAVMLLSAAGLAYAVNATWSGNGPMATGQGNRGITALVVSPGNSNVLYAGTASGGVFRAVIPSTLPVGTLFGLLLD